MVKPLLRATPAASRESYESIRKRWNGPKPHHHTRVFAADFIRECVWKVALITPPYHTKSTLLAINSSCTGASALIVSERLPIWLNSYFLISWMHCTRYLTTTLFFSTVFKPLSIINDVQPFKILKRVTSIQNPYCRAGMISEISKKQPGDSDTNGIWPSFSPYYTYSRFFARATKPGSF